MPAETTVTIIGITGNSYSRPYIVLKASLGTDPGYFGERLTGGRREIVRAWKARSAHLEAKAKQTDILGMLLLAGELFRERQGNAHRRVLVVYSDMRQATAVLNLERYKNFQRSAMIARAKRRQPVADLDGVQVYVLGASSANDRIADSRHLREFWQEYFHEVGTTVKGYSILRAAPAETVVR